MTRRMLALVLLAGLGAGCHEVFGTGVPPDAEPVPPEPTDWHAVASGMWHTCAIRVDRTLWCWGRNDNGELGQERLSINSETSTPVQVGIRADWASLSSIGSSTCAINMDHELWCWGVNANRQVSPMPMSAIAVPTQILGSWKVVAAGAYHTCALDLDGAASCWGGNGSGQLGIGTMDPAPMPTALNHAEPFASIGAGVSSTCALTEAGAAWCWGINGFGQLGNGTTTTQLVPVAVVGGHVFSQLSVGWRYACGRKTDGRLRCWGENNEGQLGDATVVARDEPVPVDQDEIIDWLEVTTGHSHTCARRASGQPYCWGGNTAGQLATPGADAFRPTPKPLDAATATVRALGLGFRRTCVIDTNHHLSCTGHAGTGALGIAGEGSQLVPTQVTGTWADLAAGLNVSCAVGTADLALRCWGNNESGAVGDGTRIDRYLPTTVASAALTDPRVVTLATHACAIANDLSLHCWGDNEFGQLGTPTPPVQPMPTEVNITGVTAWSQLSSALHSCATTVTGELWCWGHNDSGKSGVMPPASSPPVHPTAGPWAGTIWKAVAAGTTHSCAIRTTDDLPYCWGSNAHSQLGSMGPDTFTPVLVAGGSAEVITAGGQHACALRGTALRCWGRNDRGQVGDMTGQRADSPKTVPGTWASVTAGEAHTCGLQAGALWCWGNNDHGQLGDGTLATRFAPVQVGTDSDWAEVAAGSYHTCARKSGDQLWCWGSNRRGEIGDNSAWRETFAEVVQP